MTQVKNSFFSRFSFVLRRLSKLRPQQELNEEVTRCSMVRESGLSTSLTVG